ncbi:aromatic motif membrane protein [Mycoplasma sp. 48589B]
MKTKFKFLLSSVVATPLFLMPVACQDYSHNEELNTYIDTDKDISPMKTSKEAIKHKAIMNTLLSRVYKATPQAQNAKEVYILEQERNADQILEKFSEIAKAFSNAYVDTSKYKKEIADIESKLVFYRFDPNKYQEALNRIDELKRIIKEAEANKPSVSPLDYLAQYKELISKNWYFILNNLDKFNWNFVSWAFDPFIPTSKELKVSQQYVKEANRQTPYSTLNFKDSYLDEIKIGDESYEIGDNDIYYIKKDKLVFRFMIRDISSDISRVELSFVGIYFGGASANTISINLLSQTIHSGFIHGYEEGLKQYQEDMPKKQRYGYPAFVFPFGKEHDEKTKETAN